MMSALPPKADIDRWHRNVHFDAEVQIWLAAFLQALAQLGLDHRHATAAPPSSVMNSRRFMQPPTSGAS
jgi:hypothetical protein